MGVFGEIKYLLPPLSASNRARPCAWPHHSHPAFRRHSTSKIITKKQYFHIHLPIQLCQEHLQNQYFRTLDHQQLLLLASWLLKIIFVCPPATKNSYFLPRSLEIKMVVLLAPQNRYSLPATKNQDLRSPGHNKSIFPLSRTLKIQYCLSWASEDKSFLSLVTPGHFCLCLDNELTTIAHATRRQGHDYKGDMGGWAGGTPRKWTNLAHFC